MGQDVKGWVREFVKGRYCISSSPAGGDGNPFKGFNQGRDMIRLMCLKSHPGCCVEG